MASEVTVHTCRKCGRQDCCGNTMTWAICHCGDYVDDHGYGSGHTAVPVKEGPCPDAARKLDEAESKIERLTRERDEARAEAERLRAGVKAWAKGGYWHMEDGHGADADLRGYGPCDVCAWEREQREEADRG